MQRVLLFFVFFAVGVNAVQYTANPIRKVVKMLQKMQEKITEEGSHETQLYEKFQCYCSNSGKDLSATITSSDGKIPQVETDITQAENLKAQLEGDLKQHTTDRGVAKDTMKDASGVREREASSFAKEKASYESNIEALESATNAIVSGMAGSFVQTNSAQVLRRCIQTKQDLSEFDRQEVLSFLSGQQGYIPKSGEVVGILKQLHDDMKAELADITASEESSIKTFSDLMSAKKKQIGTLTSLIEQKMERVGKLGVDIATMKDDLSDTERALAEDRKFLSQLEKGCSSKEAEWEERKRTRAEELLAIAETIKVLNDDDSLELFKKTLPSASTSFLEMMQAKKVLGDQTLGIVKQIQRYDRRGARPELDFLSLSIQGKKVSFDQVIKMIDNMVKVLKTEQETDNKKKSYCGAQFDASDDEKKALERTVSDLEHGMDEANEALATVTEEIKSLESGIKELDKNVQDAADNRKEENTGFTELIASDTAAKKLLNFAKNRLNQFYNEKLYNKKKERVLSESDKIYEDFGGYIPTAAAGGIAGTGIKFFQVMKLNEAPLPPPDTFGAYTSKGHENTGVIAMIDLLIKDLDKDMTQAKTEEENSQRYYEQLTSDAASKRAADLKSLTLKRSAKASLEIELSQKTDSKVAASKTLMENAKYIHGLHAECDWLLQYWDARKEARVTETNQLKDAKAILSGADFQLLQVHK